MKRVMAIMIVVIFVSLLFAGCSNDTAEPVEDAAEKRNEDEAAVSEKKLIGFHIAYPEDDWFRFMEESVREECEKRGWELMTSYGPGLSLESGMSYLAQGVDAIIDLGIDAENAVAVAELAGEEDVPVIAIELFLDGEGGAYSFGCNSTEMGNLTAKAIADYANEHWNGEIDGLLMYIASINGEEWNKRVYRIPEALREMGFDISEENVFFQDVKTVEDYPTVMTNYLAANPDKTKMATCLLGDSVGPAVLSSIELADRQGQMLLVGLGILGPSKVYLVEEPLDEWVASIGYNVDKYGIGIAKMLDKLFAGEEVESLTWTEPLLVTHENALDVYTELGIEVTPAE